MVHTERVVARVKWFNNKHGYGFIATMEDEPRDVFVHHTSLRVSTEQYCYLSEGEYIELDISPNTDQKHKWMSSNVSGIKGGPLMCESRNRTDDRGDRDPQGH